MTVTKPERDFHNFDEQTQAVMQQIATIDQSIALIRVVGVMTVIFSVFVVSLSLFALVRFDNIAFEDLNTTVFIVVVLAYAIISGVIVFFMYRGVQQSQTHQTMLQNVLRDYQRRTDELQVAAQIARDANLASEMEDVLQRAVQLITDRFAFYHASIFLVEERDTGSVAVLRAGSGGDNILDAIGFEHDLTHSKSIVARVIQQAQARIVLDVQHEESYYAHDALPETRSEMAVPLRIERRVLGALDVQSKHEGTFTQRDVVIMQTLADLLAVAIDKAALRDTIQQYADELEERVDERTQELATERAQLNAILDAMTEGVMYYEADELIYTNQAFNELLGYQPTDWMGLAAILHNETRSPKEAQSLQQRIYDEIHSVGLWRGDLKLSRKDEREFHAHVTGVRVEKGETDGIVSIIRDISQQKALQEQQNRFVSYASHELRTPLTNLKTQLYLLKKQPHKFDHHYEIIRGVISRMQRLVDDLLTQSRFERGKIEIDPELHNLNDLVQQVVDLQRPEAESQNLAMTLTLPDTPLRSNIDYDRITQVVTNIVSNAINYTEQGSIAISLVQINDQYAEIAVQDTGVGIPPDKMSQVFQPFFRAGNSAVKGTGLGLNISKQIIDLHEGDIRVESELNKGSTFTVRLKLASDNVPVGE